MKINKRSPRHWLYLLISGFNVVCAMALRPLLHRHPSGAVLLYGHKLSGNLLAIYAYATRFPRPGLTFAFLTMDPEYHRELERNGIRSVLATSPSAIRSLSTVDAIISDHGLHAMRGMLRTTSVRFFDVWHGIPFKGFDAEDFRVQRHYDEVWVASPLLASMYVKKFGFLPSRVHVTGYARTDRLVRARGFDRMEAIRRLGLPENAGRIVLFAPTWKQDDHARNLFPFGTNASDFCAALSDIAEKLEATIVFRTHLNSGLQAVEVDAWPRIVNLPYAHHPDTEEILLATDILVCDWSSIAFDYLLLDRPTIFLDVDAPFAKGLSLDASYRFGSIARNLNEMLSLLERYLGDPSRYEADCSARAEQVKRAVYGKFADGHSAERCLARLACALPRDESSR